MYRRRLFREREDHHKKNRSIVRCIKYGPAIDAAGQPGVLFSFGNTMAVLTAEEVHSIATAWLEALADAQSEIDRNAA